MRGHGRDEAKHDREDGDVAFVTDVFGFIWRFLIGMV
jgi:hypothetical protein